MAVKTIEIFVNKDKEGMVIEKVTHEVEKAIEKSGINDGIATIFVGCSTASLSTMEFNSESVKEMEQALERIAPSNVDYDHHHTVADSEGVGADVNGHSHIRSTFLGPSVTVPFDNKKLFMEDGIDIVLLDFDLIKRKRKVIIQLIGE